MPEMCWRGLPVVRPKAGTMKSPKKPSDARETTKGRKKANPPTAPAPKASNALAISKGDDPLLAMARALLQPTVQAACTVSKYVDAQVEGGGG